MSWPATVYWVEAPAVGRLGVVARPRSAAAFHELKTAGVDVLVSLLEAGEAEDVGLGDEQLYCERAGIEFVSLPITDHGIPDSFEAVDEIVWRLSAHLAAGRGIGAHCYAGLGRSPLLISALLIHMGVDDEEATALVSAARGHDVPEMLSQHDWLAEFAARRRQR